MAKDLKNKDSKIIGAAFITQRLLIAHHSKCRQPIHLALILPLHRYAEGRRRDPGFFL